MTKDTRTRLYTDEDVGPPVFHWTCCESLYDGGSMAKGGPQGTQ